MQQSVSYDVAALRDNEKYLVIEHFTDGMSFVIPKRTLTEAVYLASSATSIMELAKMEVEEGTPVRRTLAMIVDGVWLISGTQKELTMAKVKASANGVGRDVAEDLLGVTKPRAKKMAEMAVGGRGVKVKPAKAAPAERAARNLFEDHQRIKKIGNRNTRPGSNVGVAINLIKPNMTVAEFRKAMTKAGNPLPVGGILSFLQQKEVIQVR